MLKSIVDYLSVGFLAFLGYVLVLGALMGGWVMQMITGN